MQIILKIFGLGSGGRGGGGEVPYMWFIGMCCFEGYGFFSEFIIPRIGYRNQRVLV